MESNTVGTDQFIDQSGNKHTVNYNLGDSTALTSPVRTSVNGAIKIVVAEETGNKTSISDCLTTDLYMEIVQNNDIKGSVSKIRDSILKTGWKLVSKDKEE